MKYLLYKSQANINQIDLLELLESARENNQKLGITGILITHASGFVQYIEGSAQHIDQLFDKIEQDERHFEVTAIQQGTLEEKHYCDWDMGYLCLSDAHALLQVLDSEQSSPNTMSAFHQYVNNALPLVETVAS